MKAPTRRSRAFFPNGFDWWSHHVRNTIAVIGIAILFAAGYFFIPLQKSLQLGIDYNTSEIREAPSKVLLPDVWLP
jgi:hypothetical protein